jgi:hypothetical protein
MNHNPNRNEKIKELVNGWYACDDQLNMVYLFEVPETTDEFPTVLLMQVTSATPQSDGEVVTFGFAPSHNFLYPLTLAQVTPDEWDKISKGILSLPPGWELKRSKKIAKEG